MKNLIFILTILLCSGTLHGQSKAEIKEKGITKVKTYEQRLDKGLDKKFVISEINYNNDGKIIEQKLTTRKGEIKEWTKFKFDSAGNEIERLTLNIKGEVDKKTVTKFENNLKVLREYYDSEGRLYRKKTYEYEFK